MAVAFTPEADLAGAAVDLMAERRDRNEYREAELAPGVTLVWDTDSAPYLVIERDSVFHVGTPETGLYWLNDYGPLGDALAMHAFDVLLSATGRRYEFEVDRANSTDRALLFHACLEL